MKIDARGMSCPQPVLMVKKATAEKPNQIEVLVDNITAQNNVERFLKNSGYSQIKVTEKDEEFIIKAGL